MERKFKDDEIVKALEICSKDSMLNCRNCPYEESCNMGRVDMQKDALDLIKRQKAEIERLNGIRADLSKEIEGLRTATEEAVGCYNRMESLYHIKCMELKVSKSEAIKGFAERLNKEAEKVEIDREGDFVETDNKIYDTVANWCWATSDNLVKEMTGENNGN